LVHHGISGGCHQSGRAAAAGKPGLNLGGAGMGKGSQIARGLIRQGGQRGGGIGRGGRPGRRRAPCPASQAC